MQGITTWHKKLGNLNKDDMKRAKKNLTLKGLEYNSSENLKDCEVCIEGKMTRLPFHLKECPRTTELLETVQFRVQFS